VYFWEGIEGKNRGFVLQALERDHLRKGMDRRDKTTSQPSQGCRNLVSASTHTTLGETSVCAPWADAERANSVGICLDN